MVRGELPWPSPFEGGGGGGRRATDASRAAIVIVDDIDHAITHITRGEITSPIRRHRQALRKAVSVPPNW